MKHCRVLFLGFFLFFSPLIQGLQAKPDLDVVLSASKIPANETATLTISIAWPKDEAQYSFAFPDLRLKNITLDRQGESLETFLQGSKEWKKKVFTLTLKPVQIGEARISAFTLPYIDPSTQQGGSFEIEEQILKIIKPPFKWQGMHTWMLAIALGIPFMAVLGFLTSRKNRSAHPTDISPEHHKTSLLSKIQALAADHAKTDQRDLVNQLSDLFNEFLETQFSIRTKNLTDAQVAVELAKLDIAAEDIRAIQRFLEKIKEVKYTGINLSNSEFTYLVKEITRFIEGKQVAGNPLT